MMINHHRILVATLTSRKKDYCFPEWYQRINNLSYPGGYDLMVSDNSKDSKYKEYLKNFFPNVRHVKYDDNMPWAERLAKSHNQIREFFLEGGYDYLMHIESDVRPPSYVIEALLHHKKLIVSGMYFYDQGPDSFVLSYNKEKHYNYIHIPSKTNHKGSDIYECNGKLKEIWWSGLGCSLIHKSVLQKASFRSIPGMAIAPDGLFGQDLMIKHGVKVYCDTSILCKHINVNWSENEDSYNNGELDKNLQPLLTVR